ncbi:uncharacterized protein [Diabrotica undecimpunctata]|uniref:uncharacterized protein isoform X2 n=1 Tax=Diabrotica undecimpunctata TaxID=50387 RepID=UPI003B63ADB2
MFSLSNIEGSEGSTDIVCIAGMAAQLIYSAILNATEGDFLERLTYLIEAAYEFFLFYIIPGQLLTNEAEKMEDFVYSSNWYEHSVDIKKPFINMVTCISRRPVTLNAGNLLDFNFRSAHEICRMVFSYYMFLNTMNERTLTRT